MSQTEDYDPGDSLSESSENSSKRIREEGQYLCDFGEGGTCNQTHISVEGCCYTQGIDILINEFSAFLSMGNPRIQVHKKFLLKKSNYAC